MTEVQDTIKLSKLKHLVERMEKDCPDGEDMDISFFMLVGSCFPQSLVKVKEALTAAYIDGYNAGKASQD